MTNDLMTKKKFDLEERTARLGEEIINLTKVSMKSKIIFLATLVA